MSSEEGREDAERIISSFSSSFNHDDDDDETTNPPLSPSESKIVNVVVKRMLDIELKKREAERNTQIGGELPPTTTKHEEEETNSSTILRHSSPPGCPRSGNDSLLFSSIVTSSTSALRQKFMGSKIKTKSSHDDPILVENDQQHKGELEMIMEEGEGGGQTEDLVSISLHKDAYSLMMTSSPRVFSWWYGIAAFALQSLLFSIILKEQTEIFGESTFFKASQVKPSFIFGQFLAILVLLMIQDDIIHSIQIYTIFSNKSEEVRKLNARNMASISKRRDSMQNVDFETDSDAYRKSARLHVMFPSFLKFIQGLLSLLTSFFIVITSDNIIDLFKDFAALTIISIIDEVAFNLAKDGLFGQMLVRKSEDVEDTCLKRYRLKTDRVPLQTRIFSILGLGAYGLWGGYVWHQYNGYYFNNRFPHCQLKESFAKIGDGYCNEWANTVECGFDDGDCVDFNLAYPSCEGDPIKVLSFEECNLGLDEWDEIYMTIECGFDNGACCESLFDELGKELDRSKLNNGICDEYPYNSARCQYDGGDCVPNDDLSSCNVSNPLKVGNGVCNWNESGYNSEECGWDDGDCLIDGYPDCHVPIGQDPRIIDNGICNMEFANSSDCNYDFGDCCLEIVRDEDGNLLGNDRCDATFNIPQCLYDKGDCIVPNLPNCHVNEPDRVGDGTCDGAEYNIDACNYDNGDCKVDKLPKCFTNMPSIVRNGICEDFLIADGEESDANTPGCEFEGGDCLIATIGNGIVEATVTHHGLMYINPSVEFDRYGISANQVSNGENIWMIVDSDSSPPLSSESIQHGALKSDGVSATATSTIIGAGEPMLQISQSFEPSDRSSYLYHIKITIENLSNETLTDLRYQRALKWNTPQSQSPKECLSILMGSIPSSLEESGESIVAPGPFSMGSSVGISNYSCLFKSESCEVKHMGKVHYEDGDTFQFHFKNDDGSVAELYPHKSFRFDLFYGVASDVESSYTALSSVGASYGIYGYNPATAGECSETIHYEAFPNLDKQEIFMLGFRGIGGEPIAVRNVFTDYYRIDEEDWFRYWYTPLEMSSFSYKQSMVSSIDFPEAIDGLFATSGTDSNIFLSFEGYLNFLSENATSICLTSNSESRSKLMLNERRVIDSSMHGDECHQLSRSHGVKKVKVMYLEYQIDRSQSYPSLELTWKTPFSSELEHIGASEWLKVSNVYLNYYKLHEMPSESSVLVLEHLQPSRSEMIETMDILNNLLMDDDSAMLLLGYLRVKKNINYEFCLVSRSNAKLYINDILRIETIGGSEVICVEENAKDHIMKIVIECILTSSRHRKHSSLVLLWRSPMQQSVTIIPNGAWVQDNRIYEAELVDFQGGYSETAIEGYSGPGYISLSGYNSYIEWSNIHVESSQIFKVQLRYKIFSPEAELDLFVDGSWRKMIILGTEGETYHGWADTKPTMIPLSAGFHSIRILSRDTNSADIMIDFMRIDEVNEISRYNAMPSCAAQKALSESQCSSIAESYQTLNFDVERTNKVVSLQESFSTDELVVNNAAFYLRNVGTNMVMTIESDCTTISLQPFAASDAQKFTLKNGRDNIIQNKHCEGGEALQVPSTSCSSFYGIIMQPYDDGELQQFGYLDDRRIYNKNCGADKVLTANGNNTGGSKPFIDFRMDDDPLQQWNIELIDDTVPCGCVFDKNDENSLFFNRNEKCLPRSISSNDYGIICKPPSNKCNTLRFITARDHVNASSSSSFEIRGYGSHVYGTLPPSCHNELGAQCDVTLCGVNYFDLYAKGSDDDWKFTISGDVGTLQGRSGDIDRYMDSFPTWMGASSFDSWQRYSVKHFNDIDVTIDILTDYDTHQQLQWEIIDSSTSNIFIAGVPTFYYSENKSYKHQYYFSPDQCYLFEIKGYNDIQSPAGFNLTIDGNIHASSFINDRNNKASVRFGSCSSTASPTQEPSISPSISVAPSMNPTLSPSFHPSVSVPPSTNPTMYPSKETTCEVGESIVKISIFTDLHPSETSWQVYNAESGVKLFDSFKYAQSNKEYHHELCIPSYITCIKFIIYDSLGDGMMPGGFKVYFDDENVIDKYEKSDFGREDSVQFGSNCTQTRSPSNSPSITPSESPSLSPSISTLPSHYPTSRPSTSPSISSAPSTVNAILYPVADTYIRSGIYNSINYGSDEEIIIKNDNNKNFHRISFLQFDTTIVKVSGSRAFFNIYISDMAESFTSCNATIMRIKSSNLDEDNLTFETFDKDVDKVGPSFHVRKSDLRSWIRIEITDLIQQGSILLMVEVTSAARLDTDTTLFFKSRESSEYSPFIEIFPFTKPPTTTPSLSPSKSRMPSASPSSSVTNNPSNALTTNPSYSPCEEGKVAVTVNILTDNYPAETLWKLVDAESKETLFEGSEYTGINQEYESQKCLRFGICIIFAIYDSYGDGITELGGYKVSVDNEVVSETYGKASFGKSDSIQIWDGCVTTNPSLSPSSPPTASQMPSSLPSISSLPSTSRMPSASPSSLPIITPSMLPTASPSYRPSILFTANPSYATNPSYSPLKSSTTHPSYSPCEEDKILVIVRIRTDYYPGETSWKLTDSESEEILLEGSRYDEKNDEYESHKCLPSGGTCIMFTIYDSFGDGISLSGGYKVSVDNQVVADTYGNASFDYKDRVQIWGECPTPISPSPIIGLSSMNPTIVRDEDDETMISAQ